LTLKLKKEIGDGLKSSWSPEQICGRYQLEPKPMVAFKTIYNWLYAGLIDLDLSVLRRKGKTCFYLAFKIPDRTAKSIFSAIEQLYKLFPLDKKYMD